MIRAIVMLTFWAVCLPPVALVCFPIVFLTGNVSLLYRVGTWVAFTGVRLSGVRVRAVGLDKLDASRTYIFMSNHVSNLDPPIMVPLIPRRISVMARHELFTYPILGRALRLASFVPVQRRNRDAGIAAVRAAADVIRRGINMMIYVEGGRSFDGKLLPFKKGPFYLAVECDVPVVPITIVGTYYAMPKGRFTVKPTEVQVIFHPPIEPKDFGDRDALKVKVREVINSGLPEEFQSEPAPEPAMKQA